MSLIRLRKTISVVILIAFVLLFLGPPIVNTFLSGLLLPLQLLPAILRIIAQPEALFIAGILFVVLITLIFGRVYCSFLCPLGALQDLLIAQSRTFGGRPGHSFSRPQDGLRYSFLGLTVLALSAGFLSLAGLLDPYSLAGRLFGHFLQPLVVWTYNLAILALKPFDIYLYPKETAFIPLSVGAVTAGFFLLILYLAATRGRIYCNTVCPVGTLLGLLSRASRMQFILDQKACSACVQCEKVCKAGCIDSQSATLDMSRCIGCFNCVHACSKGAIRYQWKPRPMNPASSWMPARRGFIIGGIAAAAGLLAYMADIRVFANAASAQADPPVTPPGAISTARFTGACTACSLCVSVCPTQVLTPTFLDYGVSGLLQPKMNYEKSFCDYECNLCGNVCPTGAIKPLGLDDKKLTQIGEAELLEDICVVYVDHQNCGACGEVCPTHAIRFVEKRNILYPEIDKQYCIGCGACQLACPTSPRSIIVHAKPVHEKAEKYVGTETPVETRKTPDKDFPF
ncbi:MAG: 4Fe-4S dicluster domain-containing protein [Deltaproteobacteria bacterium]|nr:4Fe-4S dicluster domain-containing protein [Deltaproteobacteria bacterium]